MVLVEGDTPWASATHGVRVVRAFGLHPQAIKAAEVTEQLDAVGELLGRSDVVAIGEIGLDNRDAMPPAGMQEIVLRTQLQLARQTARPVILHCVGAIARLLEILKEEERLPAGGMIHGFGGPADLVRQYAKLGLFFSFGGLKRGSPGDSGSREASP